jgi:type IV secretion system protein TrbI
VPQGTRLVGTYDCVIAFGQERALVIWQRLIFPDGSSLVIDNLPATDTPGYTGLADEVGRCPGDGAGRWQPACLRFHRQRSRQGAARVDATDHNRAGQRLVERNLNVQPTITVRPGWPLRVIVHKDLILRPYRGPGLTIR